MSFCFQEVVTCIRIVSLRLDFTTYEDYKFYYYLIERKENKRTQVIKWVSAFLIGIELYQVFSSTWEKSTFFLQIVDWLIKMRSVSFFFFFFPSFFGFNIFSFRLFDFVVLLFLNQNLQVDKLNLAEIGPKFERHDMFPAKTNTSWFFFT